MPSLRHFQPKTQLQVPRLLRMLGTRGPVLGLAEGQ